MLLGECLNRLRQTRQTPAHCALEFFDVIGSARQLPHHCLHEGEDVLRSMDEFLENEMDALLGFRTIEGGIG